VNRHSLSLNQDGTRIAIGEFQYDEADVGRVRILDEPTNPAPAPAPAPDPNVIEYNGITYYNTNITV